LSKASVTVQEQTQALPLSMRQQFTLFLSKVRCHKTRTEVFQEAIT